MYTSLMRGVDNIPTENIIWLMARIHLKGCKNPPQPPPFLGGKLGASEERTFSEGIVQSNTTYCYPIGTLYSTKNDTLTLLCTQKNLT